MDAPVEKVLKTIVEEMKVVFKLNKYHEQINGATILANTIQKQDLGTDPERRIKTIINTLPIYIIVAHSALDLNLHDREGTEKICTEGVNRSCFTLNDETFGGFPTYAHQIESWLGDAARFVVYPTRPGEWGGLHTDISCENPNHVLRVGSNTLKQSLINGDVFTKTEETQKIHQGGYSMFIPGSVVPDKAHQFNGQVLSGDGFGIIKLAGGMQEISAQDLLDRRDPNESIYYVTNHVDTDPEQKKKWATFMTNIRNRSKDENNPSSRILMSEIVQNGGPGFYIPLSCSSLRANVFSGCNVLENGTNGYPHHIPYLRDPTTAYNKFWIEVSKNYHHITEMNEIRWKNFFKIYPSDKQRFGTTSSTHTTAWSRDNDANNRFHSVEEAKVEQRKGATTKTRTLASEAKELTDEAIGSLFHRKHVYKRHLEALKLKSAPGPKHGGRRKRRIKKNRRKKTRAKKKKKKKKKRKTQKTRRKRRK